MTDKQAITAIRERWETQDLGLFGLPGSKARKSAEDINILLSHINAQQADIKHLNNIWKSAESDLEKAEAEIVRLRAALKEKLLILEKIDNLSMGHEKELSADKLRHCLVKIERYLIDKQALSDQALAAGDGEEAR